VAFTPVAPPRAAVAAVARLRTAHTERLNDVLNDLFRPVETESEPKEASLLSGKLPADLPRGAIVKIGPNARFSSNADGWLDGDGLVHCCVLPPDNAGPPRHSRAYVQTQAFRKEAEAGKRLFDGSLVAPEGLRLLRNLAANALRAAQPQKDTANTAILTLPGGRCLALMEQCLPSEFRVGVDGRVTTTGSSLTLGSDGSAHADAESGLAGAADAGLQDMARFPFSLGALTAHLKRDPQTREALGVTYVSNGPPGVMVHRFDPSGTLLPPTFLPLPGRAQVMIHDCAITNGVRGDGSSSDGVGVGGGGGGGEGGGIGDGGYLVVLDLPLTIRPARMLLDRFPVEYEPGHGARIGLLKRSSLSGGSSGSGGGDAASASGEEAGTVWIDVEPCIVLHTLNACETADGLVMLTALRSLPSSPESFIQSYSTALLYKWLLDPSRGVCVSEGPMNADVPLDFPTINPDVVGSQSRFGYAIRPKTIGGPNKFGPPYEGILIDGVCKLDLDSGEIAAQWTAPASWWVVSEATFVPSSSPTTTTTTSAAASAAASPHTSAGGLRAGDEGFLLLFCTRSAVPCGAEEDLLSAGDLSGWAEAREALGASGETERGDGRASRLYVLDAKTMSVEAVVALPAAVPYGLHSAWIPYEDLEA
jgi:carotenoid cleavage dioxygenase-like enzyme